ncbi:MAG: hypothetical protein HY393_02360 [Candidatus Diapherotrites archaeon]|nr:hypothetical protein [Candidatus Diapherotrites archaeon]
MLEDIGGAYALVQVLSFLVNVAIVVHFFSKKDGVARVKFVFIVGVVFLLFHVSGGGFSDYVFNPGWSFLFTQVVVMMFLALMNVPMMVQRETALLLGVIFLGSLLLNVFVAGLVGIAAYLVLSFGFSLSALKILLGKATDGARV